jgi:hypothetical protein
MTLIIDYLNVRQLKCKYNQQYYISYISYVIIIML